jgi:lipoprotein-anchoring transpeptidase ErfK/SrfK
MSRSARLAALAAVAAGSIAACSPAGDQPVHDRRAEGQPAPGERSAPSTALAPVAAGSGPVESSLSASLPDVPGLDASGLGDPPALAASAVQPSTTPLGRRINTSLFRRGGAAEDRRDQLIRIEVLLDRAHFSPGVIDGRDGSNLERAIAAYEAAHRLSGDGRPDRPVWDALIEGDPGPVATDYVIAAYDVKGPFIGKTPDRMEDMAKLHGLDYESPLQLLAEKFHMDQKLLAALNPNANFSVAGTTIVVAAPSGASLTTPVARIEVDKSHQQVRALDAGGQPVAVYPATVGSQERPAPDGAWAVTAVVKSPTYTYDPARLTFGKSTSKLTIPPGPNNPVGSTWIGLTKDTYGLHGTPDPTLVGKIASHGCVRLTNWDARQLASAVRKGIPVVFVGAETRTTR